MQGAHFGPNESEAFKEESWAENADDHAEPDAFAVVAVVGIEDSGEDGDQDEANGATNDGKPMEMPTNAAGACGVVGKKREPLLTAGAVVGETCGNESALWCWALIVHKARVRSGGLFGIGAADFDQFIDNVIHGDAFGFCMEGGD